MTARPPTAPRPRRRRRSRPRDPWETQARVRRMVRRRRRLRFLRRAVLGLAVLVMLAGAAFGVDQAVAPARHLYRSIFPPSPKRRATRATSTSTTSTSTTVPGPAACQAGAVSAVLYHWQFVSGTAYQEVELTATGQAAACSLPTYVTVGVAPAPTPALAHTAAPTLGVAPAVPGATSTSTTTAGPGTHTLAPGAPLWFEVSYGLGCQDQGGAACVPASAMTVSWAGSLGDVQLTMPVTSVPTSGFQVGPLQAPPVPASPVLPASA